MGRKPYVPTDKACQHVRSLLDAGMSIREIEASSGVNRTSIRVMLGEFPGRPASKGIRPKTEADLLAVKVNLGSLPGGTATVDAIGTRRRLQALAAIGYTNAYLAGRLGAGPTSPLQIARRSRVRAGTARDVAALYAELENTHGPSTRGAMNARARGWLTPAWWDADTIDNPNIIPAGIYQYRAGGKLSDAADAPREARVHLLMESGMSRAAVAEVLGVPIRYVSRDILNSREST
jgi:transposase-like protein